MKIKIRKGGHSIHFNTVLKSVVYFLSLAILTYFSIAFSIKNKSKLEAARISVFTSLEPSFKLAGLVFYGPKILNFNEDELIFNKHKIEMQFLQVRNNQEKNILTYSHALKNAIFDLKLNNFNLIFFTPNYYSADGFLTDIIFSTDAEYKKKLSPNMPVISEGGLFGRISTVKDDSISVVTIFNSLSRIPVYTKVSKIYGVAAGNGFEINFIYPDGEMAKIIENEEVFSSSENGLIFADIPVGKIKKNNSSFVIAPFSKSRPPILGIVSNT